MFRLLKSRSAKTGLPPGAAVYVGETRAEDVRITVIEYDESRVEQRQVAEVEECSAYLNRPAVTWINVDGLHRVPIIEKIGGCFGIHALTIEDILNTAQRPKKDFFDEYIYIVLKMLTYDGAAREIEMEQISIVLGKTFVITFQERPGDMFDLVRERLKANHGRLRKMGPDYLAHALMDAMVDHYFKILEHLGEEIELMEDELVENPNRETVHHIHFLRREMIFLRKSVWPLREVISGLQREESGLIQPATLLYFRDLYDHTIQVIDTVETFRDVIAGMLDIYLSSISNRLNEVVKVLTVFTAIFIPLTLIAGIYGMNFNPAASPLNMPELSWYYGYPFALGLMAVVAAALFIVFKIKNWF